MDMFSYTGKNLLGQAEKLKLRWDWRRAETYLLPEYDGYVNKRGLFFYVHNDYRPELNPGKRYAVQHEYRPAGVLPGTIPHDVYLSFTNSLDYRTNSAQVYRATSKLWGKYPELFTDAAYTRLTVSDVEHALRSVRYSFPTQGALRWIANAKTTFEVFNGEPVKIFTNGVENIDELMQQRNSLRKSKPYYLWGKGPKLLSLLAIMYEEFGRIPPFPRSFPVDLHVQRILAALEIVTWDKDAKMDASVLAEFSRHHLAEFHELHKMNTMRSAHMLWFRGNGLCQDCEKLRATRPGFLSEMCSLYRAGCGGPKFHTGSYSQERIWSSRTLLSLEAPPSEHFELAPPMVREPRRIRDRKVIRITVARPVPNSEEFELEGDSFYG